MPRFYLILLCFGLLSLSICQQTPNSPLEEPSILLTKEIDPGRSQNEPYLPSSIQKYHPLDDLVSLNFLMEESYYYGEWYMKDSSNKLGFSKKQGLCQFYCQTDKACVFTLHIYDGVYRNDPNLYLHYPNEVANNQRAFNQTNSTLNFEKVRVDIIRSADSHADSEYCLTTTRVYFVNTTSKRPFFPHDTSKDRKNFGIQLEVTSHDYDFQLITSVMTANNRVFDSQILIYIIIMSLYGLVEGGTCIYLYRKFQAHPTLSRRASQGTLAIVNSFDFFLAFFHIFEFMNPLSFYALISMLNALVAFFVMPPLIWEVIVSKIKRTSPRQKARAITSSYFWMLSIVVVPLISMSVNEDIIYYSSMFALIPQILDNFELNLKYRWNPWIIFCLVLPKFIFTLYVRGDEGNLFRYQPNYTLILIYSIALLLQFLLLFFQTKWPRFGYEPKSPYTLLSEKDVQTKEEVCPVCLEDLKKASVCDNNNEKALLEELNKHKKMIITPCQHKFHEICLQKWLKKKSECPNCRKELPDIINPDDDYDEM